MTDTISIRDILYRRLNTYLAIGWIIATILIGFAGSQYFNEAQRGQISHFANLILAFENAQENTHTPGESIQNLITETTNDIGIADYFIVVIRDEKVLYSTINLSSDQLLSLPLEGAFKYSHSNLPSTMGIMDDHWRLYGVEDNNHNTRVIVGTFEGEVFLGIITITAFVFSIGLIVGITSLFLARRTVRQVVEPMEKAAATVRQPRQNQLSPIYLNSNLYEIVKIQDALNDLIARMDRTVRREQSFIANAAHELRTPLAAIRAQAEAIDIKTVPAEVSKQIKRMLDATERATRLITQLLQLARSESITARHKDETPTDLVHIAKNLVTDFAPQLLDENGEIELIAPISLAVNANHELIHILLRNLIENAVKYAGRANDISKRLIVEVSYDESNHPAISVEDNGNGMNEVDFKSSFSKFDRLGLKSGSGAGLGLAIVDEIAKRQDLQISQRKAHRLGGHKVIVTFS